MKRSSSMEEKNVAVASWGSSLPVPSVQELVRKEGNIVPERYVQKLENRLLISQISPVLSSQIPVIDLNLLANGDGDERKRLDLACREWGFFQVRNHGVTGDVLEKMKAAVSAFFELPLEEKKRYAQLSSLNDMQGYGQGYVKSDDHKLDWNDLIFLLTSPTRYKNMKFWPALPGFKESVEKYSEEMIRVSDEIFGNLSLLMGMEREGLKKLHGETRLGMRMNYYPQCSRPDLVMGLSPHSDGSSITLLLQDDDVCALQIQHDQEWVPVIPLSNAIVVNIGDAMEVWSNGAYKSIEHRAITNERKPRMSTACFVTPADDIEIGPVETMVNDSHLPRAYKKVKYVDYVRYSFARKMDGKANLQFLKL